MKKHNILMILTGLALIIAGCKKSDPVVDNTIPPLGSEQQLEIVFVNNSGLPDDSILFSCMGYEGTAPTWNYCWVDADSKVIPVKMADNTIDHDGYKYTNYSHSLKKVHKIVLGSLDAARIRLSVNTGLWMRVTSDNPAAGITNPDWNNPNDPNAGIIYDKIEFSYKSNKLWINTTSVDYFGIPYTLSANVNGTDIKIGTSTARETIFKNFHDKAPADFQVLVQGNYRIVAPNKLINGFNQHYFDAYINSVWEKYKTESLIMEGTIPSEWSATGKVDGNDEFVFHVTSTDPAFNGKIVKVMKPTSHDVFGCDGALKTDDTKPISHQKLVPQIGATLNRSTLLNYILKDACEVSTFYQNETTNWFSKIMHEVSVDHKCYGFSYDDDCSQSSLFPSQEVKQLTITITKFK